MNKIFINLINIFVNLLIFRQIQCKECPSMTAYYNPMFDSGYVVRSFLMIPNTKVLIINTYLKASQDQSIVYYNDMYNPAGEIINVIQPDYTIIEMNYIQSQDKILAYSYDRIVIANPYTLKSERYLSIPQLIHAQMLGKTDYAIATLKKYVINIIDTVNLVIFKTLDNSKFPFVTNSNNFFTKCFSHSLQEFNQILITVNSYGFYSWSFDLNTKETKYNGYITPTIVNKTDYAYRQFTKHPQKDIYFVGGANLEIISFEIVNLAKQTYRTLMKLNLYDSKYKYNVTNIAYKLSTSNSAKPLIIIGDGWYIYDLVLSFNDANNTITTPTYKDPPWYQDNTYNYYTWYEIPDVQDQRIIMSGESFITLYNYYNHTYSYNLYFGTNWISRRFMYERNERYNYFLFVRNQFVQYADINNIGNQIGSYNTSNFAYNEVNNVNRVKNCSECLILKTIDNSTTNNYNFMTQIIVFPIVNYQYRALNISSLKFNWTEVNINLDPFFYNNQTWVVFGFRNKTADKKFLFTLINMYNITQNVNLTGASDEENSRQSSFALASVEDPENLEIIGVDLLGYIYVWDILSPKQIKYSRKTNFTCLNSDIGTIYQYNKNKWLIFVCDDMSVLSYDFQKDSTQSLMQVVSNPLSLKSFPILQIIAIGDTIAGNVYIYKFDGQGLFSYFLTIQPGQFKDRVISIELIKNNTIWVQYYYSNMFYSLGNCIQDVRDCLNCQQTFYFNTSNSLYSTSDYGNGTLKTPYTSSNNFLNAMLRAQLYQNRISGITNINVQINVDPQYHIYIPNEYLNIDFSSIIQLTIKSQIQNNLALFKYDNILEFSNFNYICLQDINIQYQKPNKCGINFKNIASNATLNNILLQNSTTMINQQNCFQISADNTNLQILQYSIHNQDFSLHKSIISTLQTDWVEIQTLSLDNCTLGDTFSIVDQKSNLRATMKSINITNNICTQHQTDEETVSSLFSAGLFSVQSLLIQNNSFCNKIIFSQVSTLDQKNYEFFFNQVNVLNNSFMAKTSYLFFNSLYSMRYKPSHTATFQNMIFQNNKLIKNNENNQMKATFIQTIKISNHIFENIIFKNHHEISLISIEFSDKVQVNTFQCINDKEYLNSSPNSDSGSCLQLYDILSTKIQGIRIRYKKAYNHELINLQNKLSYIHTDLNIIDGEFSNMVLIQQIINSFANPITIYGQNQLTLSFQNCSFFDNSLEVIEGSQTFSTTAFWIENSLGTVKITDSIFKNSISNSIYNFMFIETNSLEIAGLSFDSSSFGLVGTSKQLGGFMNLIIKNLIILDSSFNKSKSQYGSFIYIQSFGSLLKVDINNTYFSEGYAEVDGGALYIDIGKSILNFKCTYCFFDNIYTFFSSSSAVGLQKYKTTTANPIHEMIFQGGHIQNIYGVGDNFFTDIQNMKLSFINVKEIKPLPNSNGFDNSANQQFGERSFQQSTLVGSENSEINIQGCNISGFKIKNQHSILPLIINSVSTLVSIIDSTFIDGEFVSSAIKVTNGHLSLKNSVFTNLIQQKKSLSRQLQTDESIGNDISSLIIMQNSSLIVSQQTQFQGNKCYNNCTGAVFYLMNTNFEITDILISNSEATFGGSLFIEGLKSLNKITSSKFEENIAQIDGGAIYLQALNDDRFSLKIENCNFLSNSAVSEFGKGGGLFIRSKNQNSTNQLIEIIDSQFIGNIAQIGGGIYQKEISPKILGVTIFKQNVGKIFGNDTLSYPTHLRLASLNEFIYKFQAEVLDINIIAISNFRSGDTLTNLSFQLINDQEVIIRPLSQQELQEFSIYVQFGQNQHSDKYQIRGNIIAYYSIERKSFVFNDFDLIGIPGSQAILQFKSDEIYILDKNKTNQYNQNYFFQIIINFRSCIKGEYIQENNQLTECKICQEGKYSFDLSDCVACPSGATCEGGSQMIANQGYWRKTNESTELIICSELENCKGGSFGNHICFEGHIGALCDECDITGEYWNKNYAKSSKNTCTNCEQIVYNAWFVILLTLWALISMTLAIRGDIQAKIQSGIQHAFNLRKQIRQNENSILNAQNQQCSFINQEQSQVSKYQFQSKSTKKRTQNINMSQINQKITSQYYKTAHQSKKKNRQDIEQSATYIKILTNYFQIVGSIASFNLAIPSNIFYFPSSVGQPLKQTLNSLDCILKDYKTSIPFIYQRLVFSLLIPVAYFLIFLICLAAQHLFKRKGTFPWYILSTVIMFLIIYVQPDMVSQLIALMSCRQIGDTNYILANVSYQCYTNDHQKYVLYLISPLLTTWVLILPSILFFLIFKNKSNLNKFAVKLKYGFLYKEYKKEAYYWEFIKMIQKICIILCLNFYSTTVVIKGHLVFIIIVVYGFLSILIEPYIEKDINQLDIQSTSVCAVTILLGLFIYQNPYPYLLFCSLGIIIIINIQFLFTILKRILSIYIKKIYLMFQDKIKKFALKIPKLRKFLQKFEQIKKVNPVVQEKVKKVFENYLSLSIEEKQKMKIRIMESQFKLTMSNMFGHCDYPLNNIYNSNNQKQQLQNTNFSQNYLLTQNPNLSPQNRPWITFTTQGDDEENQQIRGQSRFNILAPKNENKQIYLPLDIQQSEFPFKEDSYCRSSYFTKSKRIKFLNSLNSQTTIQGLNQVKDGQDSYIGLLHQSSSPTFLLRSESAQINANDQDAYIQLKRDKNRLSIFDDYKLENVITPKPEVFEESEVHNERDDSKNDLESKNNYQSKEIKLLCSLNMEWENKTDEIQEDEQKEGQQKIVSESQVREFQNQDK